MNVSCRGKGQYSAVELRSIRHERTENQLDTFEEAKRNVHFFFRKGSSLVLGLQVTWFLDPFPLELTNHRENCDKCEGVLANFDILRTGSGHTSRLLNGGGAIFALNPPTGSTIASIGSSICRSSKLKEKKDFAQTGREKLADFEAGLRSL
jgi:hypothetical protein